MTTLVLPRPLLRTGLGVATLTMLLSACGDDGSGDEGSPSTAGDRRTTAETTVITGSPSTTDAGTGEPIKTTLTLEPEGGASPAQVDDGIAVLRERLDALGLTDATLSHDGGLVYVQADPIEPAEIEALLSVGVVRVRGVHSCVVGSPAGTGEPSEGAGSDILPALDGQTCRVSPAATDGRVFEADGNAELVNGSWGVRVSVRSDASESVAWDQLIDDCYQRDPTTCPAGQVAIELDGVIMTAPVVATPTLEGAISIVGAFDEAQAEELALVLRSGALPFPFRLVSTTTG
ncbi:MAG: hypothetical protein AB7U39_24080 [Ilumatobacteraceae bacterium]